MYFTGVLGDLSQFIHIKLLEQYRVSSGGPKKCKRLKSFYLGLSTS